MKVPSIFKITTLATILLIVHHSNAARTSGETTNGQCSCQCPITCDKSTTKQPATERSLPPVNRVLLAREAAIMNATFDDFLSRHDPHPDVVTFNHLIYDNYDCSTNCWYTTALSESKDSISKSNSFCRTIFHMYPHLRGCYKNMPVCANVDSKPAFDKIEQSCFEKDH